MPSADEKVRNIFGVCASIMRNECIYSQYLKRHFYAIFVLDWVKERWWIGKKRSKSRPNLCQSLPRSLVWDFVSLFVSVTVSVCLHFCLSNCFCLYRRFSLSNCLCLRSCQLCFVLKSLCLSLLKELIITRYFCHLFL